jgi:hypothetical protein
LQTVRSQIAGLGQSALNNASEQRGASDSTGGMGSIDIPRALVLGSVGAGGFLSVPGLVHQFEDATVPGAGWKVGDLAGLTPAGTYLTAFDAAEGFTSGDPAKVVDAAASVTASVLKSAGAEAGVAGAPVYLSGVIVAEAQEIGHDALQADWSSSGMAMTGQYIVQHPMDALAGANDAIVAALPRLIGIFKP